MEVRATFIVDSHQTTDGHYMTCIFLHGLTPRPDRGTKCRHIIHAGSRPYYVACVFVVSVTILATNTESRHAIHHTRTALHGLYLCTHCEVSIEQRAVALHRDCMACISVHSVKCPSNSELLHYTQILYDL